MKSIFLIICICLSTIKGFSLADPYTTSVYGYTYSTPVGTTQFIRFNVGNGNSADRVILAGSVEWTLNFPTTILSVGTGYTLPAPFYEYGRTSDATSTSILIRTNADIDYLANSGNPMAQAFTLYIPVTGTVAGTAGTISGNNRVLPGFNGTVGNGNSINDNATSPIIFSPVSSNITINGNVWNDFNGNIQQEVAENGTSAGTTLYVNLVDAGGNIISSTPIDVATGAYSINAPTNVTGYKLVLATSPTAISPSLPYTTTPGDTWVNTGESVDDASNSATQTTIVGQIELNTGTSNIVDQNFGIEQRPVANNMLWNVSGAVENNAYKVGLGELDDANGEQLLNATDPEEGQITNGTTFQILSVPKNATGQNDPSFELRYNGTLLVDGDFIENFNPDWLTFTIKTTSPPNITSFLYNVSDNAGVFSISPATYSIHLLSVLPVTGLHLKVTAVGVGRNHLEWQTLTEIGTSYSDIERSTDGNTFVSIGRVQAAENSNQRNSYIFTDDKAPEGIAYYRVRLVDKDGRNKLSNVAVITPLQWQLIKLMPNPARSFIVIAGVKEGQDIRINGISGALVRQLSVKGISSVIDLAGFAAGTYIIQVYEKGRKVFTGKFIKQD